MKRFIAIFIICLLVGTASATSLNFQNPGDVTSIVASDGGNTVASSMDWIESATGGNNYIKTGCVRDSGVAGACYSGFKLVSPTTMTYAAATHLGASGPTTDYNALVQLQDSSGNVIYTFSGVGSNTVKRFEMKMSGGVAHIFSNGVEVGTSGALAQNPSFVVFGIVPNGLGSNWYYTQWDDAVWGQTENKVVLGLPESDDEMFIILDDILNDASDGLYNTTSGTQADANYMSGTWSRGNASITPETLENQSIQLVNFFSHFVYATYYTDTAYSGTIQIDIKTLLIDANAPDGLYALYIPGSGQYSNRIWKKSNGASVQWSSKTYSTGDSGSIISVIASGGYWDTSSYEYTLVVQDVYGVVHGTNTSITTQTQTVTHTWNADTDNPGVYYAVLYATSRSTGQQYIFGFDYTTLSSYVNFNGYVNNGETQTVISGANVSMTQDGTACNTLSAADGNYTCSGFSTGATWYVNATAIGFRQYTFNATPLAAKGVALNISLEPVLPVISGIAIGGVDRDTTYGRPIKDATVTVRNSTSGLYCYKTTSMTGWYINDDTDCLFQSKTPYDVWAYKVGYTNSTTERTVTV